MEKGGWVYIMANRYRGYPIGDAYQPAFVIFVSC